MDHTTIPQNSWIRQKINIGRGAKIGFMSVPEVRIDSPDLWIFSASSQFDEEALRRWHEDPQAQYDCCYRIKSERLFFQAISRAIADRAEYVGCVPVHYYPGEDVLPLDSQHGTVNPARFKAGKNYGPQSEVRAIWRPRSGEPIEPFSIEIAELAEYCEIHRTL